MTVPFDAFSQLDLRVGKIEEVADMPQARKPLYQLRVGFGDGKTLQCVAGIKQHYTKEQLMGKTVVAVVNLEPRTIAGVVSECMLLASFTDESLSLVVPDKPMQPGDKVG